MFVEFGGNRIEVWEFVVKKEVIEVEDYKIEIIGLNIDEVDVDGVLRLLFVVIVKIVGKNM